MYKQKQSGFTIIEIIIVLFIMSILTTIAIVSLRTSRDAAQDRERRDDVAAIARHFEAYYKKSEGIPSYPSTSDLASAVDGIDPDSLRSPSSQATSSPYSLASASNANDPPSNKPTKNNDQYIYQPIAKNSALCSSGTKPCVGFKIYYYDKDANGQVNYTRSVN